MHEKPAKFKSNHTLFKVFAKCGVPLRLANVGYFRCKNDCSSRRQSDMLFLLIISA